MIAEAGLAALWLAAAMALLQIAFAALGLWLSQSDDRADTGAELLAAVRPVAVAQAALALFSFLMLVWLFARSDMSVLVVAENSHSMKPMLYKIAGHGAITRGR